MFNRLMVALIRRRARKNLGKDIAPLQTLASHPEVLIAYARFNQALRKTHLLSTKLKELAQVRVAKLVECPF
jgi:hypothetical protein